MTWAVGCVIHCVMANKPRGALLVCTVVHTHTAGTCEVFPALTEIKDKNRIVPATTVESNHRNCFNSSETDGEEAAHRGAVLVHTRSAVVGVGGSKRPREEKRRRGQC